MDQKKAVLIPIVFFFCQTVLISGYQDQGYQYLYPKPDSKTVSPRTTLIIRLNAVSPNQVRNLESFISVTGDKSGIHPGETKIASDQKTIIYTPDSAFIPQETVTVLLQPVIDSPNSFFVKPVTYTFSIVEFISPDAIEEENWNETSENEAVQSQQSLSSQAMIMPNGVSVPSDFPHVEVTVNDNPCTDYIFIDNRGGGPGRPYNVIFDNHGSPVWYMHTGGERRDFKVQPNGWITMMIRGADGYGHGEGFIAYDENFNLIKEFYAVQKDQPYNVSTDEHELQVLEDGGYLLIALRWISYDCSPWGGPSNSRIYESGIQEFTADDDCIFQWWATENGLDPADAEVVDNTSGSFRFPHMNSIDIDEDGHIILSCRNLSEVIKIHRQTGEKIWRLGGAHNQFAFIDDPLNGQKNQHAARALGGGRYSIFDNGVNHSPQVSRAVIYQLDTTQMMATLEWEYQEFGWYSYNMGNAQVLSNGNVLINWARTFLPKLTEIRPDGSMAFQMDFAHPSECYRVHRCPWEGRVEAPVLDYEMETDYVILLMNKFGDPDVDYYRIYAGRTQNPQTLLDTSNTSLKKIDNLGRGYQYIRVTAVNHVGEESGYSNQERVYINFTQPGENLVQNGDFTSGRDGWTWELQGNGEAEWSVDEGAAAIDITAGGSNVYDVQLRQSGIALLNGNAYVFEFDARAENSRTIEAKVGQDESPYTNYSQIPLTFLTPAEQHFSYTFDMEFPSDDDSRVVFNMGQSDMDVYLDNISLKQVDTGVSTGPNIPPDACMLYPNYPNPFNPDTRIEYQLSREDHAVIRIYNVQGGLVRTLVNSRQSQGRHHVVWDGKTDSGIEEASGVYLVFMQTGAFKAVSKITLLR